MITIRQLLEKGAIDINDDIEFKTHADVLRLFGTDQKLIQRAFIRHPHEEGTRIWFPMFYDDDNNDWINTASQDYGRVFEKKKIGNDEYLADLVATSEWHRRILFAKIRPANRIFYKFKGVYQLDVEMSLQNKKAIYERVATSATLFPA